MSHTLRQGTSKASFAVAVMVSFAFPAPGCGDGDDDVISYSQPVGINFKVKSDEAAKANTAEADKNVTTESGNPYGAFVHAARAHLGGADPARIDVRSVTLLLGGMSKGVTALEEALAGSVEVLFVMNDTNNTFKVAEVKDPKGTGPVNMSVRFAPDSVLGDDYRQLVGGNFKVVLRSPAAAGFPSRKDAEADLQVTLEFVAY